MSLGSIKDLKLIAFDLDGTLAESKKTISPEMGRLLYELSLEHTVAIISGGSILQYERQLLPFLKPSLNIVLLPVEGTERFEYDMKSKKWVLVEKVNFPKEKKDEIKKVLKEIVESASMYGIPAEHFGERIEDRDTEIAFSGLGQDAPLEKKMAWDPERVKRMKIKEVIERRVKDVSVAVAGTSSIDILPKGFDKAKGLGILAKKLGIGLEDIIFAGDAIVPGGNDYSVKQAGIATVSVTGPAHTESVIREWLGKVEQKLAPIAYFCSEYALSDDPSMYAGGLGILAGDFLLEIADQNVPFVAIGLKYSTSQPEGFTLLPQQIEVPVADATVQAKVWHRSLASNVDIYLLESAPLTQNLYDADFYIRIQQQMVLGIGGVRLLNMLGINPRIFHLNEGHVAFAGIAILAERKKDTARIVASKHTILTDAGIRINSGDFEKYFGPYCRKFGLNVQEIFDKGLDDGVFSTTGFLMKIAVRKNAVSKLHAYFEKKRHAASALIPITNGVYRKRWQSPNMSSDDLLGVKKELRTKLIEYIQKETGKIFDPNICTLVWARRLVAYKRPLLLLSDPQCLKGMKLQIVISGKAHPADKEGQSFLAKIMELSESPDLAHKIVYLPHYDLSLAHHLVQGADIWLNTPELGKEACGTSGMKAGLNGALQCSIQDGWVAEVDWKDKGWALPEENTANTLYDMLEQEILPCFYENPLEWQKKMRATIEIVEKSYTTKRMLDQYLNQLYN